MNMLKNRYFKIEYCRKLSLGGGQVKSEVVEFKNLTLRGSQLRDSDNTILTCIELK